MGKGADGTTSTTTDGTKAMPTVALRVAIAGAGFSGAILARHLSRRGDVEVACFEKMAQTSVRTGVYTVLKGARDGMVGGWAGARCDVRQQRRT